MFENSEGLHYDSPLETCQRLQTASLSDSDTLSTIESVGSILGAQQQQAALENFIRKKNVFE